MKKSSTSQIHPKYDREFFNAGVEMTLNFLEQTLKGQNKVIDLKLPAQLHKLIDIKIGDQPVSETELLAQCKKILEYQPKPYHPHFRNKLFGGFDQYSVMGAMMAPCINGTTYTYQIAPCFTIMQQEVYEHMRKIFEWEKMDAIMTPGGSFANFYGIELARHHKFPNAKQEGTFGMKPQVIYTSEVSHYSIQKGAILLGIGNNNVIKINTDDFGRMIPSQLQKAILKTIEQGKTPLMVNATIGTTQEGNIDPVQQIADICEKHKVWLHLDGALGGSFWISEALRKKAGSAKRADSVSWDPHKALLVPLQASIFFCKYENLMSQANSTKADCLFHRQRASYDCSLDTGDKSLQCGRVIDILKLWVYFKGNGWKNIAKQVEVEHQLALFAKQYIQKNSDRFKMAISQVDTFNVCYWAIPKNLKRQNFSQDSEYYAMLSKVTVLAKKYMIEDGKILVGYQKSKGDYYFWRTVMSDPYLPKEELIRQIQLTLQYCESSYAEVQQFKRKQEQRTQASSEHKQ